MKIKSYFLILSFCFCQFIIAQTGTTFSGSIVNSGVTRTYTFYVPQLYDSLNVAVPLVFNIHGAGGTSAGQETDEDFRKIADTANFIIVHPQGLSMPIAPGLSFKQTGWNVLGTVAAWNADKTFIINLLEKLATEYNINRSRVYLTGYSEGGFMGYDFACFVSGRFAAIGSICGSLIPSHYTACAPAQPTPVMEIHGTNDPVIAYDGNGAVTTTPVDNMINYWVTYNNCGPTPDSIVHLNDIVDSCCAANIDNSKVVHYVYGGGTKGASVELYKVLNGGHTIPVLDTSASDANHDFDAAKEMWRFFSKYSLDSLGVTPVTGTITSIGINQTAESNTISIYPNPSNGTFTLQLKNFEDANLQIINLLGEIVFEEKLSKGLTKIDLNETKGVYLYQLKNKAGMLKSGKIIIN
jgi:polyhydroxybutyrate depolymerase